MPPMCGQNNSCQSKIRIVVSWTAPREISKQDYTEPGKAAFRTTLAGRFVAPLTLIQRRIKSAKNSYVDSRALSQLRVLQAALCQTSEKSSITVRVQPRVRTMVL
jgi:hypothetical protein